MPVPKAEPRTRIGFYLRRLMDLRGYESDSDLAKAIRDANPGDNFNPSVLSKWSSGAARPTLDSLKKVAPVLDARLGDLLVEAELATPDELGMTGRAPDPEPIDPGLRRVSRLLADPNIPEPQKAHLRNTIAGAVEFWERQLAGADHREPTAAERAAGRPVAER